MITTAVRNNDDKHRRVRLIATSTWNIGNGGLDSKKASVIKEWKKRNVTPDPYTSNTANKKACVNKNKTGILVPQ